MRIASTIFLGLVLLFGTVSCAQVFEVYGEYSYLRFNPTLPGINNRSFSGGGGGATFYFARLLGIKGELMGYGSTSFTTTFGSPVTLANGATIPAGTFTSQGNMFTYLFGPVVRIPIPKITPLITPSVELLFGGSNTNGYANLIKSVNAGGGIVSGTGTQHPFTMAFGGGLDISVSQRISIRPIEIDYLLTRYTNPLTSTNNQNNFRYLGGVVFKF
jgi:hypothetical protein